MPRTIPDDTAFDLDQQLAAITDVMLLMDATLRIADDAGVDDVPFRATLGTLWDTYIPIDLRRPDVGTAFAACGAGEPVLQIGQPHIASPLIGADLDRV